MAKSAKGTRVPVWVQPEDRDLVQSFAGLCETAASTDGRAAFQITLSPSVAADATVPENSFIQDGTCWTLTYGPSSVHLVDSIGLHCIAHLVESPYEQVSVLELSMLAHNTETTLAASLMSRPQEAIDRETISSVVSEANRLQEEIQEAADLGQEAREEEARAKLEELVDSIQSSRGKGGHSRPVVDAVERARQAVHTNVRRALGAIRHQAPPLALHLKQSISLSRYCTYEPAERTSWTVQFSSSAAPL